MFANQRLAELNILLDSECDQNIRDCSSSSVANQLLRLRPYVHIVHGEDGGHAEGLAVSVRVRRKGHRARFHVALDDAPVLLVMAVLCKKKVSK